MGMGLVGAFGAKGGADAVRSIREELLKRQQLALENDLALRGADRADRQMDASLENNRLMRELQRQQFEAQQADRKAAQEDRDLTRAVTVRGALPPETFIPEDDPSVSLFEKAGLSGTLRMAPATQAMGPDFVGPMPDGETPQEAQVGRVRGRLTMPTAQQAQAAEDDRRAQAQLESQQRRDEQSAKYQDAIIGNMGKGGAQTDPGWTIKEVTDPATNKTSMVRVNSRTGEVQPVALPEGMQPGGSRQTRLSAGQQDDLATMKTVEDMATAAEALGEKIQWKGVGGLWTGSAAGFAARNFGAGTPDEETLRNNIGNIQATIAKLRGGTSFTTNEQKLLESYTPTINDSDLTIKAKLASLKQFIQLKRQNTLLYAGGNPGAQPANDADPLGLR